VEGAGVLFPLAETEQSIADRFEGQVRKHPDRVAVFDRDGSLTYAELNTRANCIAHYLANAGVAPGSRVVICLEKSAACIAAILGVLKAGHAYVPIDPSFPADRNQHIAADCDAAFVVTSAAHTASALALGFPKERLVSVTELLAAENVALGWENPQLDVSADAPAYIIYTSGSTGKPKGVLQNQRGTLHGCMRRTNLQRITHTDRMSLFYSCSVMGSVYCIFGALLNGAALLPYDIKEEGLLDLARWIVEQKLTIYHSVASVFRQFAETFAGPIAATSVRLVIFGGERVLTSDVEAARTMFSRDVLFFTGLGSTETGTVRHFFIGPETVISSRIVPIGYPVEGVDIVLSDECGVQVGTGTVGEINVVSRYLALGYWNDPVATAKVFSSVPGRPELRSYRMGDMAELGPDGLLEHRGRRDFQVKIRGFRVEVGEIESILVSHAEVFEGVVQAIEIGNETQLVAYIVPRPFEDGRPPLTAKALRAFLREKLPAHMVPTLYAHLERLPKTPNGKVNRQALPAPLPSNALPEEPQEPAATATEAILLAICQDVVGRRVLGISENFFDVGGDSLSATRLAARVEKQFGVRLSMRTLFSARDLRALAVEIDLAKSNTLPPADAGLVPAERPARIPTTPAQRRMWLIDRVHESNAAYNISNSVRLRGPVDTDALEAALNAIVLRHEILRTRFSSDGDDVWQEVSPFEPRPLPVYDWSHEDELSAAERTTAFIQRLLNESHDLAAGPLVRWCLLRLGPSRHVLVLVFNHIVYDNIWSSRVFFEELAELYSAQVRGVPSTRPPLPVQFADYALWEQQRLESADFSEHLEYFKRELRDPPSPPEIPSDRPRPTRPSFAGGQVAFYIPAHVRQALKAVGHDESATPFMALLATWQLLLARYSGQSDILVGTPTGRRYRTETEGLIGLFINNLVLRAKLSEEMSFRQLLRQVRRSAVDAFSRDELPFEDLVRALRPRRTTSVSPYFQHFFIHRNATSAAWTIPGLEVEPINVHASGSKFDLTLSVLENEHRITGTIEYSADLFDRPTIERMAENFVELLTSAVHDPDACVWKLEIASEAERRRAFQEFNPAPEAYPEDRCTHELVAENARTSPERIAVIGQDERLTYAELWQRAERIAARLQALGVGAGSLVAVCMKRSPNLLAVLLGVMESGAAYVPLDPDFPRERLAGMIEDSQARVLISEQEVVASVQPGNAHVLLVGADGSPVGPPPRLHDRRSPARRATPADLAYVIYTSGSTGKPKGVEVTHRGLVNFLYAMKTRPGLGRDDVVQAVTTICFDIAGLELYLPLLFGARVVIGDRETSQSPDKLRRSLIEHGVTLLQATPITWRLLLDSGWNGMPHIKVLCGGEAMGQDLAERLIDTGCDVWNMYGPTETTIWSTAGEVTCREDADFVGEPIANTDLFVTNAQLALQPIGVPGELLIGGHGLARGYLGQSELTEQRFVQSPFDRRKRLYRTGDQVVRRPSGQIEFLGRLDQQVKIRGFRVELGDIEAHLADHPSVKQAIVVARDSGPGEKRLVAYCVPNGTLDTKALTKHLAERLPQYMIPAAIVALDDLPTTPNGKVDRKALPAPASSPSAASSICDASGARNDLDRAIIVLWQIVLGRDGIGIDDDFFALGGDSMLALRLVRDMRESLSINFPLATLFETPTIRSLVDSGGKEVERAATIVRLNEVPEGTPIYCLAGIQPYKPFADRMASGPIYAVYASREITRIEAEEVKPGKQVMVSVEEIAGTYYDALVRHLKGPRVTLVGHSFGGLMALEVASRLRASGYLVESVILFDAIPKSAYARTLGAAVRHLTTKASEAGVTLVARDLFGRLVDRFSKGVRSLSGRRGPPTSIRHAAQGRAYRGMRGQFDLTGKSYDFDVLLIKATVKDLGIGQFLKPDYDFGRAVRGQLSIAEVPADHLGLVRGDVADEVFTIVSTYMARRATS